VLDEHLAWMKHQHEKGTVLFSGPGADGQMGIYLLRTSSPEAADAVARSDPFTAKGLARFDLIEWDVHQAFGQGSFEADALGGQSASSARPR
jgi:uncharacterized protein YciI